MTRGAPGDDVGRRATTWEPWRGREQRQQCALAQSVQIAIERNIVDHAGL